MGNLGWSEMFFIVVFALILFGPRKLPEIARTIGRYMAQIRRMSDEFQQTWEAEIERESLKEQQNIEANQEAIKQLTAQSSEAAGQLEAISLEKDEPALNAIADAADAHASDHNNNNNHNDALISESKAISSHNVVENRINSGLKSEDEHPVTIA
jgi:Tat protein translocase TatB subunit